MSDGDAFRIHGEAAARRKRREAAPSRSGPVVTSRLHRLAQEVALDLAEGDERRFRIVNATTVIVLNRPRGG